MESIKGRVYKCKDNIDTDLIIPARYLNTTDPTELAKHAMEDLDTQFISKPHDIILAGKNFGSGSSREHAPIALKASGVRAIIAKSFARIFYRNAINIGLPVIILKETEKLGSEAEINLEKGEILSSGKKFSFPPFSGKVRDIITAGGLISYLKNSKK
ncbi:MAG: 3-isopropylmalate dehydratase small subunit [Candidatus Micrarchaeota archaeon]